MTHTAKEFRAMARKALAGKWKTAIIVTVLAAILGAMTVADTLVQFEFKGETGAVIKIFEKYSFTLAKAGILAIILASIVLIWTIITIIIGGAMTLGYYQFHQNLVRNQKAEVETLFVHKNKLWHGFCLNFWQLLYIFLWSLCLIIPGIIAGLNYSMAIYIANDHPEMTAREALAASKEMMKGHRWNLFCLEISFFGWAILSALTLGIGSFALAPYQETAKAFFYQELLDNERNLYNQYR